MSDYYKEHSKEFIDNTFKCDMSTQYCFFEKYLSKTAKTILDLGFGSGRDSLYFMSKGYEVYAIDPTESFCKNARKLGIPNVYQITAQELNFENIIDGIWACASLLHVPSTELNETFKKCSRALKSGGVMYASFKYGNFEGERNGREFLDLNENTIVNYLADTGLTIVETLITQDVRPDRTEKWLNVILRRNT